MKFNPLLNKITLVLISLLVCQIFTVTLHKSRSQIMSANREDNKDKASASPAPAEDKKKKLQQQQEVTQKLQHPPKEQPEESNHQTH